MALFEVPGWSVPDAPAPGNTNKRKRNATKSDEKVSTAEINFEKLMKRLESGKDVPQPHPKKTKGKQKSKPAADSDQPNDTTPRFKAAERGAEQTQKNKRADRRQRKKAAQSSAAPSSERERDGDGEDASSPRKRKKKGGEHDAETKELPEPSSVRSTSPEEKTSAGLTAMQAGMRHSLDGARFRYVLPHLPSYCSTPSHRHTRTAGGSTSYCTSLTALMRTR